jgi:DNA polymerase III delta subunit
LAAKYLTSPNYQSFIAALKLVVQAKESLEIPRLIVVTGSSDFLQLKACQAIKLAWQKLDIGEPQLMETSECDQTKFQSCWSQVSLFEPEALYLFRRAGSVRGLAAWLAAIASPAAIKSHIVLECADKITADVQKQITRLQGVVIHAVEPVGMEEYSKVAETFLRRAGLELDHEALKLILSAVGMDLGKIENAISTISLQFAGQKRRLTQADIASSLGSLREDDVFELFNLLRNKRSASAHLVTENFINRGESAIAITGIFSRFTREQIERGSIARGIGGLLSCAAADRQLKSSRMDDTLILSNIIETITDASN